MGGVFTGMDPAVTVEADRLLFLAPNSHGNTRILPCGACFVVIDVKLLDDKSTAIFP
jgi:hypothetical protein